MIPVLSFVFSPLGRWVVTGLGVLAVVFGFAWHQRSVGARQERAQIEQRTTANVTKAQTAARKSRSGTSGVLDPYRRAE